MDSLPQPEDYVEMIPRPLVRLCDELSKLDSEIQNLKRKREGLCRLIHEEMDTVGAHFPLLHRDMMLSGDDNRRGFICATVIVSSTGAGCPLHPEGEPF